MCKKKKLLRIMSNQYSFCLKMMSNQNHREKMDDIIQLSIRREEEEEERNDREMRSIFDIIRQGANENTRRDLVDS